MNDFTKKDMPINEDQYIDVINEDPKVSNSSSNKSNSNPFDHEELDDLMFDMTAPNTKSANNSKNKNNNNIYPSTPGVGSNTYVSENG